MATEGFPRVAILGGVFTKITPGVVKWIGSTVAIGSGCAGGVSSSVLKNELESGEDLVEANRKALLSFFSEMSGTVVGSIISGIGAELQAAASLTKNPKRGLAVKYFFGTFAASVGSGFLCFEGWEYLERNRQNHGSK